LAIAGGGCFPRLLDLCLISPAKRRPAQTSAKLDRRRAAIREVVGDGAEARLANVRELAR
jgi:hypothetical protein